MVRPALFVLFACAVCFAVPLHAVEPTPLPGHRIDLARFTVDGVGLESSAEEVEQTFGPPEETQKISGVIGLKEKEKEEKEEEDIPLDKRPPEAIHDKVIYSYFRKGIKIIFNEEDMSIDSIDLFIEALPPYETFIGSFVQPIPIEVREIRMLRPFAKQIYKDGKNMLFLKKDDRTPRRETAMLFFTLEGWLSRITFREEENYTIDIDRLCVAGVCMGDSTERALEVLGPPDAYGTRGKSYTGQWFREGLKISAGKHGGGIYRIAINMVGFDGVFLQSLPLTARKTVLHDYLGGRIYQEGNARICAFRKGEPLSKDKLILKFDQDDRLKSVVFESIENIDVDFANQSVAGLKVGDSARDVQRILGRFDKSRRMRGGLALGFLRAGVRVVMTKAAEKAAKGAKKDQKAPVRWGEAGRVRKIEAMVKDSPGLHAAPFSLADHIDIYKKKAAKEIFREKEDTLYLSRNGRPPNPGVATLVTFEKTGWPQSVVFREFRDIVVDMKTFTVSGVGLGTHIDEVRRILGNPAKARLASDGSLEILSYVEEGITVVIDQMNRSVCKIIIDMDAFEGSFAQEVAVDSDADTFEKVLHPQIYKQDEKTFWLTRDGAKPTWEEAVINFSLSGGVDTISFQTLAVKKEGLLLDITRELE
jgi:hypothetical protein